MKPLAGKTAIVTGASRGSGRAVALALAQAGAQVIVHYAHATRDAQAVVDEIRALGSRSNAIAADLSAPDGPHRLARQVHAIVGERLDILVANAGIGAQVAGNEVSVGAFDRRVALNVRAPYFLVQQLRPIMCKGSSVIFLLPGVAHDAVADGAVRTLTRHFAFAFGERGVRVNAVRGSGESMDAIGGGFEGVGGAVTFLASDAARWVTGEIVELDRRAVFSRDEPLPIQALDKNDHAYEA
jgi:3-oxoacyl-[acyl-carrier protein] reductase